MEPFSLPATGGASHRGELDTDDVRLRELIKARTPARLLVGRAGPAYRTVTQLELRRDHASAVDAVHWEINPERDFGSEFIQQWNLFEVRTRAQTKIEHLMRPDLGRRLDDAARQTIANRCPAGADLQVVIGDGLSGAAVVAQVPGLLPLLRVEANQRGWSFGQPFLVRYCRVGTLNDLGEILGAAVFVLLIGERPGLATAESLSAYMAYRPQPGHTDADRNLISNIHARGVGPDLAARRIAALAEQMRQAKTSGVAVKENLTTLISKPAPPLSSKTKDLG
jgi:ethanolamine ammonia-lyase small subunit